MFFYLAVLLSFIPMDSRQNLHLPWYVVTPSVRENRAFLARWLGESLLSRFGKTGFEMLASEISRLSKRKDAEGLELLPFLRKIHERYHYLPMPTEDELYSGHIHFVIVDNTRLRSGWKSPKEFENDWKKIKLIRGINGVFNKLGIFVHYIDEPVITRAIARSNNNAMVRDYRDFYEPECSFKSPFYTVQQDERGSLAFFLPIGGARNVGYAYVSSLCNRNPSQTSFSGPIHLLVLDDDTVTTRDLRLRGDFKYSSFFSHNADRVANPTLKAGRMTGVLIGQTERSPSGHGKMNSTFSMGCVNPRNLLSVGTRWGKDLDFPSKATSTKTSSDGLVHLGGPTTTYGPNGETFPRKDTRRFGTHYGGMILDSFPESEIERVHQICGIREFRHNSAMKGTV